MSIDTEHVSHARRAVRALNAGSPFCDEAHGGMNAGPSGARV
jgi:hypothetical protein